MHCLVGGVFQTVETMSRLYDTVEPAVVDDEMLRKAVEEQGPKEEAGKIAKQEGVSYCDVLALRLDFRSKYWLLSQDILSFILVKVLKKFQFDQI